MKNREAFIKSLEEKNIEAIWMFVLLARGTCNSCYKTGSYCKFCKHELLKKWLESEFEGVYGKANEKTV